MTSKTKTLAKPLPGTYPPYMDKYLKLVKGENILEELYNQHIETTELITSVDEETLQFRYAEGKWNIREIIQHIIDTERIYAYRALCIARNDKTSLPGFDENRYAEASMASGRSINDLVRELSVMRASSMELYKSFTEEMLDRTGTANGAPISVRAIIFMTVGHEMHHRNVIEERYLPK